MAIAEVSGAAVVFLLILAVLVAFITEVVPNDVTAISVVAALVILEPWTGVGSRAAISGFANPATVTIIAMYMLSAGIQNTGIVERLGVYLADFTGGRDFRALVATVCTTGPIAGFVNNTPVVAVFIPMVTGLAEKSGLSPSKLLLPLSYAAILGGTLTLIGTSTNILASDFARLLIDGRDGIGMFEFTGLGAVLLAVGTAYLLTVGWRLTPARVPVDSDPVAEFDLDDYLTHLYVRPGSPAIGQSVEAFDDAHPDVRILQIRRDGEAYAGPHSDRVIESGDDVIVHGPRGAVTQFREAGTLGRRPHETVTEETFESSATDGMLAKAVVPDQSPFVGETVAETGLHEYHETGVLALRRGGDLFRTALGDRTLEAGDLLLVRTTPAAVGYFTDTGSLVVADERALDQLADADADEVAPLSPKTPIAVGVLVGVVALAALDVLPIVIAALAGVVVMVVSGCLTTADAYDAVSWNVIFLLAGVIPLGIALESTGGAALVSEFLVATGSVLPTVGVMFVLYAVAGVLASVITPVATVVLMTPVGVNAAAQLGANEFAFLLAVMFASATSFMTPVGYQTNLMVYGPGGYEFTDFLRVGGPLQLLLAVVATTGIAVIWGV
jgi:di/tricarboxylate transporter